MERLLSGVSLKLVLALVQTTSKIKANASVHRLDFIHTENFKDIKAKITTPAFAWSYKTMTVFFP